jgi:hypothetical protein
MGAETPGGYLQFVDMPLARVGALSKKTMLAKHLI